MKCILLRTSLLCLLLLFIFCINVSFASVNYSKFIEFNFLGDREDLFNQVLLECTGLNINDFGSIVRSNDLTNWNNILNEYNSNNYVSIYFNLYHTSNSNLSDPNYLTMMYFNNNDWSNGSGYNCTFYKNSNGVGMVTRTSITSQGLKGDLIANYQSKFIFVNNKWYYADNSAFSPVNPSFNLTYNNLKTSTISISYNGNSENFIKADYDKSLSSWRLGYLSNFESSGAYEIYGQLQAYVGSDYQGGLWGQSVGSFTYKKGVGIYNNGLGLTDTSQHDIYISSDLILYNQGYCLFFDAFDSNGNLLNIDNKYTYLYFVSLGDTSTSGDLINPNLNNELDFGFINSVLHITDDQNSSGNNQFIINSVFSGDFSGDLFKQLGYVGPSDSEEHYGFIHNVFNSLIAVLIDTNTNVTLPIEFHGYQKTLYASDFTTPETPLKGFCRLFLIFGFIILFYQFLVKLYLMFLTLDLSGVLKQTQIDFTLFM